MCVKRDTAHLMIGLGCATGVFAFVEIMLGYQPHDVLLIIGIVGQFTAIIGGWMVFK